MAVDGSVQHYFIEVEVCFLDISTVDASIFVLHISYVKGWFFYFECPFKL